LFNENVEIETFNTTEDEEEDARVAAATDMAFQIIRNGPFPIQRCQVAICVA
jgi:hypothetical protein